MIAYGRQDIRNEDVEAVVAVLESDWLTQGPVVPAFEQALASHCNARYAVAVSSGTAALHVACMAMGLGEGDALWTSPNTFVASANCALYCGATVDFVDIDPATRNLSLAALTAKLEQADREGCLPKIVVAVDFAGLPCELRALRELADRYGFKLIEDACHSLGGAYAGQAVGACHYADAVVFSLHPVKNITAGEGGVIVTEDPQLAERAARLRSHGITRGGSDTQTLEPWYYQQTELGYNYRLSDIHAALGLSQLPRLADYIDKRRSLAAAYDQRFADSPLRPLVEPSGVRCAYHLYVVEIDEDAAVERPALFAHCREAGIGVNVHYIPVYWQPVYRRLGFEPGHCPATERYYSRCLTLPLHPGLDEDAVHSISTLVKEALQ